MSDGGSAIGHATGVRAIVRGCDRANAQGAGKSVILPDGNGLSRGLFGLPQVDLGASLGPLNRVSSTGRGLTAAIAGRWGVLRRPDRLYWDVIFQPRERQWQIASHDYALYASTVPYV